MNGTMLCRKIGKRKDHKPDGIRLAKDYWSDSGLYGRSGLSALGPVDEYREQIAGGFFGQTNVARHRSAGSAVKEIARKLVYSDGDMVLTKELSPGQSALTLTPTAGACMDFACVITTTKQDRDGDVLESDGADVDPRSPFLWQHMPVYPIGKLVAILDRNSKRITGHIAVIDNALGRDAAQLIEFGALRISHGFKPTMVEEMIDKGEFIGYHVRRYRMLEVSGVSVPANEDAVITLYSRQKFTSLVVKSWAENKYRARPTMVRSGYDGVTTKDSLAVAGQPETSSEYGQCATCGASVKLPRTIHNGYVPTCPRCVAMREGGFVAKSLDGDKYRSRLVPAESKGFDVASEKLEPSSKLLSWVSQYLEVQMRDVYQIVVAVPAVRLGSFLTGLRIAQAEWTREDVRSMSGDRESVPLYETLQLSSKAKDTFLIDGVEFFAGEECNLVVDRQRGWGGMYLTFFAPFKMRSVVEKVVDDAWTWAKANNFLRGEAFALSGEFLTRTSELWSDLFLEPVNEKALQRVVDRMNAKGGAFPNYGMILCGPPGTGKTLSGRILRNQAKATFIWVSASDFYRSGAFGGLSTAFDLAKELSPAIVFVEDVDNWLDKYTIDYLKTELDGIARSSGTLTVLTTNYPEMLPDALIDRPGRFHDILEFDLPTRDVRRTMLEKWITGASPAKMDAAADATDGYSGAHVYHLAFFARSLKESESVEIDEAVDMAIKKIKEQRDLINGLQLAGSRFRPTREVAGLLTKCGCGKGAVPYKPTVKADDDAAWDGDAAVGRLRSWAGVDGDKPSAAAWKKYAQGFAWFDSEKADALGSYKLPHHDVKDGKLVVVFKGVAAAMGAINGARGGADVGGDRSKVYQHLAAHYKQFDKEPPELGGKAMDEKTCPKCGGKIGDDGKCVKCGYQADKPAGKAARMTPKKVALLKDAQKLMMAAHDHDELKDASISKPLIREAHAKVEAAIKTKVKPDTNDDNGEPNPEMDDDDVMGPNPGIAKSVDELAVTFMAEVMKGAVSWETLHDAQRVIADAIAAQEIKAAEDAAA